MNRIIKILYLSLLFASIVCVFSCGEKSPNTEKGISEQISYKEIREISSNPKVVSVAVGEFIPSYSEYSYKYGYVSHIIQEAFKYTGYKVVFTFLPWKRAYNMTVKGNYDSCGMWYKTPEREKEIIFSDPVELTTVNIFYRKRDGLVFRDYSDLKGKAVGVTLGYTIPKELIKMADAGEIKIDTVPNDKQNLKKLLAGRIDLFPAGLVPTLAQMRKYLSKEEVDQIAYHSRPLVKEYSYLVFSKKISLEKIKNFNQGLKKMKSSGKLYKIIADAKKGKYNARSEKWSSEKK